MSCTGPRLSQGAAPGAGHLKDSSVTCRCSSSYHHSPTADRNGGDLQAPPPQADSLGHAHVEHHHHPSSHPHPSPWAGREYSYCSMWIQCLIDSIVTFSLGSHSSAVPAHSALHCACRVLHGLPNIK